MKKTTLFLTLSCTILLLPNISFAAWSVWAEPLIIDKVRPSYNPAIKNTSINLKGAKGEWLAFYVVMRGDENINNFVPSVQSTLTSGSNTIANSNWTFYMCQMVMTTVSTHTGGSIGAWPDPCVPYKDRFYGEIRNGTEQGWNKSITANNTQPFLFEIYIPSNTVTGTYSGTIRLTGQGTSGTLSQDIPVTLTVWNFTVPLSWSYGSLFGFNRYTGIEGAWSRTDYKYAHDLFIKSAVDHGIWIYDQDQWLAPGVNTITGAANFADGAFNDNSPCGTSGCSWGAKIWLDGAVPNSVNNSRPYLSVRPKLFEIRTNLASPFAGGVLDDNAAKHAKWMDDWDAFIAANNYGVYTKFLVKTYDEPPTTAICCTSILANTVNRNTELTMTGGATNRPYVWTWDTIGAISGCGPNDCSDLNSKNYHLGWCPENTYGLNRPDTGVSRYPRSVFDSRVANKGDIVLNYTAESSNDIYNNVAQIDAYIIDSWFIDTAPMSGGTGTGSARQNAAGALSMWQFNTVGFHYWASVNCFQNGSWIDPDCGFAYHNGDGFIWYFGDSTGTNANDIGGTHDIPIESLRMKLWRWGMNVLEYAKLLEAQGKKSIANTQINNMVTFAENGNTWGTISAWEAAREAMANEILGTSPDTTPPSAPTGVTVS